MFAKLFNDIMDKSLIEIKKDCNRDRIKKLISPFLDYTVNYSMKVAYPYLITIILILILFIILLILTLYNVNFKLSEIKSEITKIISRS